MKCNHCGNEFYVTSKFQNDRVARFCRKPECQRARKRLAAQKRRRRAWEDMVWKSGKTPIGGFKEIHVGDKSAALLPSLRSPGSGTDMAGKSTITFMGGVK